MLERVRERKKENRKRKNGPMVDVIKLFSKENYISSNLRYRKKFVLVRELAHKCENNAIFNCF